MPELPEVETVRRGLEGLMVGRRIERVEVLDARLVQPIAPGKIQAMLAGRTVSAARRRGKYLVLELDDGILVALHHLRMTGSFAAPTQPAPAHVRLRYHLEGLAGPVAYNDPRRFGTLRVDTEQAVAAYLDARLGPEPLEPAWDAVALQQCTRSRSAPLKAVLLDQRVVAGLGNIYVDEACFRAGVRPDLSANRLTRPAAERLVNAVRACLIDAIAAGGSTLRDYRGVEGELGGMQERFFAYGRAGLACVRCGTIMRGARIAGRGTSWCPRCQPATRPR